MPHKKKGFDVKGLLFTILELNRQFDLGKLEEIKDISFCNLCLGANIPGQKEYARGAWCCGSYCNDFIPILKICENFQANTEEVRKIAEQIRPTRESKATSYSHADKKNVNLFIGNIKIKI